MTNKARLCWQEAGRVLYGKQQHKEDPLLGRRPTRAAAVLLAACVVGPCVKRIAKFLVLPRRVVAEFGRSARKNGIWRSSRVSAEYFDKDGGIALCLDTNCLLGLLSRA